MHNHCTETLAETALYGFKARPIKKLSVRLNESSADKELKNQRLDCYLRKCIDFISSFHSSHYLFDLQKN